MTLWDRAHHHYRGDSRASMAARNRPSIAWNNEGAHFTRTAELLRASSRIVRDWGRTLYCVIRSAKYRRLQRELMWHGIPYSYLLEDKDDAVLPRPGRGSRDETL